MKLNGALKPRHGASIEGSSTGAGPLRKYRDKRYPQDTCEYVSHASLSPHQKRQQPLKECGVKDANISTAAIITTNSSSSSSRRHRDNSYEHPQQHEGQEQRDQPQQSRQLEQQRRHSSECDVIVNVSGSVMTSSTSNGVGITLTTISNTHARQQNSIKSVEATRTTTTIAKTTRTIITDCSSQEIGTTTTEAAAVNEPSEESGSHGNSATITLKQTEQLNIITGLQRQGQQLQSGNNCGVKPDRRNEHTNRPGKSRVGEELPIANYHAIPPTSEGNNATTEVRRRPHCWKEVCKLSSFEGIYEGLISRALPISPINISRLFEQFQSFLLRLILLMFSAGSTNCGCGGGATTAAVGVDDVSSNRCGCRRRPVTKHSSLTNIMRASQSFMASLDRICFKNAFKSRPPPITTNATVVTVTKSTTNSIALCLLVYGAAATLLLPQPVLADEGDNFFSPNGIVIGETTTEFDYASRGQKKFGDKCDNTLECGFPGSICDTKKKSCQCTEDLPVTNHIDKCGKEAAVNESCFFNEQCEAKYFQTECRDGRCVCRFDMTPIWLKDGSVECKGRGDKKGPETYIDPAMIGVLIGMALMFIIICVVLRLFSQARWRENRTIFNTPNPRLMNVSLLRESKLLHGQERRGSRMSVRAPSRQPSMASLRPHSPNPSLGKTGSRSNSHGSNASATSLRSTRSNSVSPAINHAHHERKGSTYHPHPPHQLHQQQHHPQHLPPPEGTVQQQQQPQQPNIIANPVAESVTVDIIEPEK